MILHLDTASNISTGQTNVEQETGEFQDIYAKLGAKVTEEGQ